MRYVLNIKYTWIVCLELGRGIDRHAYRDIVAAAYNLQISRLIWVDDIDPIWIIIVPRLGHTEITVSYSDSTFGYRMAPTELKELRSQLQELLDKGFIRPSVSLGVHLFYSWKRNMALYGCALIIDKSTR